MVRAGIFSGCFAFLALTGTAMADSHPGSGGITLKPLIQSQAAAPSPAPPPLYPMTYSDQVAQSLGVRDGGVELRSADRSNPYAPSLRFTGGMLRLQWRP